jgi:hypothetical protein
MEGMMATTTYMPELRASIAHALLDPGFRASLQARNDDGEAPIVPARVDDTVVEIFERVDRHGGAANVVLRWEGDLFVLCVDSRPVTAARARKVPCQDVGDNANLGMVLALMAEGGIPEMRLAIVESTPHWVSRSRVPASVPG